MICDLNTFILFTKVCSVLSLLILLSCFFLHFFSLRHHKRLFSPALCVLTHTLCEKCCMQSGKGWTFFLVCFDLINRPERHNIVIKYW